MPSLRGVTQLLREAVEPDYTGQAPQRRIFAHCPHGADRAAVGGAVIVKKIGVEG